MSTLKISSFSIDFERPGGLTNREARCVTERALLRYAAAAFSKNLVLLLFTASLDLFAG